jgi:hypothetical protein
LRAPTTIPKSLSYLLSPRSKEEEEEEEKKKKKENSKK